MVVNLSIRDLTPAENSLLSKGLSFCPTPRQIDIFAVRKDLSNYIRRVRIKEYFYSEGDVDGDVSEKPAFRKKSTWCPDKHRDLVLQTSASVLERKIFSHDLTVQCHRNLSEEEQGALDNLKGYDDIIIKQADNGSAVVVMDREKYVGEALRQLSDRDVYIPLTKDLTGEMIRKINGRINRLRYEGFNISLFTH